MIWTKIKAAADAVSSVVKSGYLLMWPQNDDGVISLKYKDSEGNIGTIAGGNSGDIPVATTTADGLMSSDDKAKLNGIADNANNYTLPAATTSTLGGVIVDTSNGLSITEGVINIANATTEKGGALSATDKLSLNRLAPLVYTGTISSNAYAADYTNGDIHLITTSGDAVAVSATNIPLGYAIVLRIDNSGGSEVSYNSSILLASGDIGVYLLVFINVTGTIILATKTEEM